MSAPWWTEADQAEQEVLLDELVALWFEHRQRCSSTPCPALLTAAGELLEWRRRRLLRSRATSLRALQADREAA